MNVRGLEIGEYIVEACEARMRRDEFKASDIIHEAMSVGRLGGATASRLADRLIQNHRRRGDIEQVERGLWRWKGGE